MTNTEKLLSARKLPELLKFENGEAVNAENWEDRRNEILDILRREEYGYAPPAPEYVKYEILSESTDFAGKAFKREVRLTMPTDKGEFSFNVVESVPNGSKEGKKYPVFVLVNFRDAVPDKYYPVEDIVDAGFASVRIYYNDIAFDGEDGFSGGIAAHYDREKYNWGKIGMWAWSASRVFDYLEQVDWAELEKVAVIGHSRLGKTALWCAANDTRFALCCANDSGCSGDAITRDKKGEHIDKITERFPYWFCDNYKKYAGKEEMLPFDQHFLVAAICPRRVALGSAVLDEWADPDSQYLSACAASEAWRLCGGSGFVHPERLPKVGDFFTDGDVAFHLRDHAHFLSNEDWRHYFEIMKAL